MCKHAIVSTAVHCEALQAPNNGHIAPNSCLMSPTYGTMCHFTCRKGYRLHGEPIAFCLRNGQWSLKISVFCKGQFVNQSFCQYASRIKRGIISQIFLLRMSNKKYQSIEQRYDNHPYCVALRLSFVIRISKVILRHGNEAKTRNNFYISDCKNRSIIT